MLLWMKAFHIIAMVAWFAGLFYLPRLFVYHADLPETDAMGHERFCTMERRLFWGIMTPSAIVTILLGIGLVHMMGYSFKTPPLWLSLKLALVGLTAIYHVYCGVLMKKFSRGQNCHSSLFYRIFNEITVFILVGIVLLVVIKPS
jgi:putative membrane protein